jgi:hypothetical protein
MNTQAKLEAIQAILATGEVKSTHDDDSQDDDYEVYPEECVCEAQEEMVNPLITVKYKVACSNVTTAMIGVYIPREQDETGRFTSAISNRFKRSGHVIGEFLNADWGTNTDAQGDKYRVRFTTVEAQDWVQLAAVVEKVKTEVTKKLRESAASYKALNNTQPQDTIEELKI